MPTRRATFATGLALALSSAFLGAAVVGCEDPTSEDLGRSDAAIIGGQLDTTHKGVVSLLKHVEEGYFPACSGTLITRNLVLTAHHCVAELTSEDGASVECGKTEFGPLQPASSMLISVEANVGREGLEPFHVSQVWVPPGDASVCGRDIALLLLSDSGVPDDVATPIEPELGQDLAAKDVFAAIGYGLQDPSDRNGDTAGHRMSVTNAEVFCDGAACDTDIVAEGEFIADSPVCSGDSGGPALDKNGRVGGVTSRGDQKCTVGIYSSVYTWRDFIIDKTFEAASTGNYAPPAWAGPPPLGRSCNGECPSSYKCWAESGQPPGICVPECSAASMTCPDGFSCDTTLNACIEPRPAPHDSSSCSVVAPAATRPDTSALWLGLGLLAAASLRRRQR